MNLADYSAVSFDIFDTLIKRMVPSPDEVFKIIERAIDSNYGYKSDFYNKRLLAKEKAKSDNRYYCLEDVYRIIDLPEDQKKDAILLEKKTEIDVSYPNKKVVEFYKNCKNSGLRVFLISDMYLDRSTIESILKKCGIIGYEKLYVSQEEKKEKNGGDLYKLFLAENNLSASKVLHVGDNLKVDIISARICGIHTKRIKESFGVFDYSIDSGLNEKQKRQYLGLLRLLEANYSDSLNEWQKIGYECLGPLLFGFVNWLATNLKKDGIKKVYFLSREGSILKKSFEIIHQNEFECYYLYVSRRSLTAPSYYSCKSYEDVVRNITLPKNLSVKQFYDAIGIEYSIASKGVNKAGLSAETEIDGWSVASNKSLADSFKCIEEEAFDYYHDQYLLINRYLDQNHFSEKVAIVDIGWNGTMQRALEEICSKSRHVEISGYYFGLNENNKLTDSKAKGYIYEPGKDIDFQYYLMGMSGPLELMTTAEHGTTIQYLDNSEGVTPDLAKSEYFGIDKKRESEPIIQMQNGGLLFVERMSKREGLDLINIDGRVAVQNYFQFGKNPTIKHRSMFYGMKEYDGTVGLVMLNPDAKGIRGKGSVIEGFWNSSWKIGYMRDKLHLPLPYHKIYMWMRKRK